MAWRPLDILGMSVMSCRCQILTNDGHSRFWLKYDFLTSSGSHVDITIVVERSNSDQTRTLWADVSWMSWWCQWVIYYVKPDRPWDIPLMSKLTSDADVQRTEKVFTKWGKCDVIFWRHTGQNLTFPESPRDVRLLAGGSLCSKMLHFASNLVQ